MATVLLYPIFYADEHPEFRWSWRSADSRVTSAQRFALFHECVVDARTKGHTVNMRATLGAARTATRAWAPDARRIRIDVPLSPGRR